MTLAKNYRKKVIPNLQKLLKLSNIHQVPRLEKVVLNIGIGSYIQSKDKNYEPLVERLSTISGQKPIVIHTKMSVSNFKLRKGMPNGIKITLRGKRMLNFLERLINIAIPRTRDFRGLSKKSFDQDGNYSLGIKEITIFPEIEINDVSKLHGLQVNIITSSKNKDLSYSLLEEIGLPFKKPIN